MPHYSQQQFGVHEAVELHELFTMKMVCASKARAMQQLAQNAQLKELLQTDYTRSRQQAQELQNLLQGAVQTIQ